MSAHQKPGVTDDPVATTETLPSVANDASTADIVGGPEAADPAPDMVALLQKLEAEAAELRDAWLRSRADTENIRKQAIADVARAHKYGIERFAGELLLVKDSLESSLAAENAPLATLKAGVELTLKQLSAAFDKVQLTEINPLGQKFDPHRHQAMAMVDSAEPAIRSCRFSRRVTCSPIACCGPQWSPWRSQATAKAARTSRFARRALIRR